MVEYAQSSLGVDKDKALNLMVKAITSVKPLDEQILLAPLCNWIKQANELALQTLYEHINTLCLEQTPQQAIETLYNPDSDFYTGNTEQALQVCLAIVYHHQLLLSDTANVQEAADITISMLIPFHRAVIAAYQNKQYQYCIELAQQGLDIVADANLSLWSEWIENIATPVNYFQYLMVHFCGESLLELEEYQQLLQLVSKYESMAYLASEPTSRIGIQIFKGLALLANNQVFEAQVLFEELQQDRHVTQAQQIQIEANLAHIYYLNTGDPRHGLKMAFSGLTQPEAAQFFAILDSEMSGILSAEQQQRKRTLIALAFSEERITQVVERTGSEYLGQEIRKYKKQFVDPRMSQPEFQTVNQCLKAHNQAVKTSNTEEAARTLKLAGMLLTSCREQNRPIPWQDLKNYIEATTASKQLEEFLTQSEYISALLIQADNSLVKPLMASLQSFFSQLINLASTNINHGSPQLQRAYVAYRKHTIDNLLVLLADLAFSQPKVNSFWLKCISQLKTFWDFNGLNAHLQHRLHRYKQALPSNISDETTTLAEQLSMIPVTEQSRQEFDDKHNRILSLMMPLNSQASQHTLGAIEAPSYQLILLDTSSKTAERQDTIVIFNIIGMNRKWHQQTKAHPVLLSSIAEFIRALKPDKPQPPSPLSEQLVKIEQRGEALADQVLTKELIIDPPECLGVRTTGTLQQIPLEALPVASMLPGPASRQWFGELTTTALLTGNDSQLTIVDTPFKLNSLTLFANPIFSRPFKPLPGTAQEADDIALIFADKNVELKLQRQRQANRINFLSMSGTTAPQVLHLATHGYSDEYKSEFSALVLSHYDENNQAITPAVGFFEISLMDLRQTELVVLSACSTHHGKPIQGECVSSIAWAFKAAGAKAVIGTRWPVSDKASSVFWRLFYQALSNGSSIAQALTQARRALIQSTRWRHPKYWASYQLIV